MGQRGPQLAKMAWRNLWRQKRRTLLTLVAIVLGFFLAVVFTAMQDYSFADMIDTAAKMDSGHVSLQHPDSLDTPKLTLTVKGTKALRQMALDDPDVERVVERISGQAMLSTARQSFGVFFIAYDPAEESQDTLTFLSDLETGALLEDSNDKGIVLGQKLADNLGVELGDKVVYKLIDRQGEVVAGLARLKGTVRTGAASADAGLCLLPIDRMRSILGYEPDEATRVSLYLNDSRASGQVAARLNQKLQGAVALTWDQLRPELSGFIAMKVGGARIMELVIMLLVAASIFNTLFVSVLERTREFGIMLAIGYSPAQLFRLIMWESLWLALVGLVTGALLTVLPYWHLSKVGVDLSAMTGKSAEVAGVGFDSTIRVGIFPENLAIIAVAVVVATLASGLYPAWRAGRTEPVESIKIV